MLEKLSSLSGSSQALQQLQDLRTRRLLQIIAISLFGLLIALILANGATRLWLLAGSLALCCAGAAAFYHRPLLAAYLLLWSMVLMLSGLAWVAGGLRDIAVLGYPGVLIYAALFGSSSLFVSLLLFIIGFCALMAWATAWASGVTR